MSKALVLVDLQNDFCDEKGSLFVPGSARVIASANEQIAYAVVMQIPIYATRDWHPADHQSFAVLPPGQWPVHCVQDTPGAAFHPDVALPTATIIVNKGMDRERDGYSAFEGVTLEGETFLSSLIAHGVDHLYLCGVATDYCVWNTALDALATGLRVTIHLDGVAGVNADESARKLAELEASGARLIKPARRSFARIAVEEGWTADTQVAVLMQYIDSQHNDDALSDFCEQIVADERQHRADDPHCTCNDCIAFQQGRQHGA
jgi:nicotinamidase/pyrazinamidase